MPRTSAFVFRILPALAAALAAGAAPARGPAPGKLRTYQTRYYTIHTDLDRDGVREAALRMTTMAEEYHRRTKGFSGTIRKKLPFCLFRRPQDYYAAGGPPGSAGVFKGNMLMAIAGDRPTDATWRTVQHEGFHQFAHAVIRGNIPVWVNEGLAEYFGEGLFTGDGFVVGVVPSGRLGRLKRAIRNDRLKTLREMMRLSHVEWGRRIAVENYDQAWSMIHFLVHGRKGRYVKALSRFINNIGRGTRYENAWVKHFGRDVEAFEKGWRDHWLAQPARPTEDLYTEAVVATLTGFFARSYARRQVFDDAKAFLQAAEAGTLKVSKKDWLPPTLLKKNLAKAKAMGKWAIETPKGLTPRLTCTVADGRKFTGTFRLKGGRVEKVKVKLTPKPTTAPSRGD